MAGKSVKERVRKLKREVARETSFRDPSLTWVSSASPNVVLGRLLSLHVPDEGRPFYKVELQEPCEVKGDRRVGKNDVVCVEETDDISCLRFFVDEMSAGVVFDVWLRYHAFRQEVQVKKIVGPLS